MSACYVILAHVTWALAREWALFIRAAKAVTWALTREWVLARNTTVLCESVKTDLAPISNIDRNLHTCEKHTHVTQLKIFTGQVFFTQHTYPCIAGIFRRIKFRSCGKDCHRHYVIINMHGTKYWQDKISSMRAEGKKKF